MLDGKPLAGFYSNKASALIAYLALTRRAPTRDALAALLWGEMSDADAKMNLRQCLTNLRKLLAPHLLITRDSVEFNFDAPYALDVEAFEHKLRAAVEPYTGDFLDGVFVRDAPNFEEWMLAQPARRGRGRVE
jgi:DNA-binding SARP family transcriptional activator